MKFNKILSACLMVCFTGMALAANEGVDYVTLEKPIANADKTLVKVFSYDCPFCYKYAKAVDKMVSQKVEDVSFTPFHLKTKGKYGIQGSLLFAVALVRDKTLNLKPLDPNSNFHKVEMALYKAYHDKKMRWDDGPDSFIKTGLDALGIDRNEFDKYAQSPEVNSLIERWEASYAIAKIQGVPAYVVNGKYLLLTKNIRSIDSMAETIKDLSSK